MRVFLTRQRIQHFPNASKPYTESDGLMTEAELEKAKKECVNWRNASTGLDNYVVQSNELIMARQDLSKNAFKLVRATIMQIKPEDEDIDGIFFTIGELAELYGVSKQALYPIIDDVTDEIMSKFIEFRVENKKDKVSFRKVNWTSVCQYESDKGVFIRMNRDLMPDLVGLKKLYTQYPYSNIMKMGSVTSMRIFEILLSKIDGDVFPRDGRNVVITIEELVEVCKLEGKYKNNNDLKRFVIDKAVKDINNCTVYEAGYTDVKVGKTIVAFNFNIRMEAVKALVLGKKQREQKYLKVFGKLPKEKKDDNVIELSYGGGKHETKS